MDHELMDMMKQIKKTPVLPPQKIEGFASFLSFPFLPTNFPLIFFLLFLKTNPPPRRSKKSRKRLLLMVSRW